jgi:hypothetical protein
MTDYRRGYAVKSDLLREQSNKIGTSLCKESKMFLLSSHANVLKR